MVVRSWNFSGCHVGKRAVFLIYTNYFITFQVILMTLSGSVNHGTRENDLVFGGDHNLDVDPGILNIVRWTVFHVSHNNSLGNVGNALYGQTFVLLTYVQIVLILDIFTIISVYFDLLHPLKYPS